MAKAGRIPTPPAQQWRRFRYRYMPIATFGLLAVVVLSLWQRHTVGPAMTGEFYALSRDARSLVAGQLVTLEDRPQLAVGDRVHVGDIVARLDEAPVSLELNLVNSQLEESRQQIDAAIEQLRLESFDREANLTDSQLRLAAELRQLEERLDDLLRQEVDHRVKMKFDEMIVAVESSKLKWLNSLIEKKLLGKSVDEFDAEVARDAARQRLEQSKSELVEIAELKRKTEARVTNLKLRFPEIESVMPDRDKLLAPLHAAVETQLATLGQVSWRLEETLDIKAPISGVVRMIHYTPGQPVLAGEPIVTIASEENRTVIAYLRAEQQIAIKEGARVAVRLRTRPRQEYSGIVRQVGPHEEQIPIHQTTQRDPNILAWGVPIRIELTDPQVPDALPGSLVDVWPQTSPE